MEYLNMSQFERVIDRINKKKHDVFCNVIDVLAKKFDGIDAHVYKAAKELKQASDKINSDTGLNYEGKRKRLDEARQDLNDLREIYQQGVLHSREVIATIPDKIAEAIPPQTVTEAIRPDTRMVNIHLWERELATANADELDTLFRTNADNKDFMRLLNVAEKQNKEISTALIPVRAELKKAMEYQRIIDLQALFNTISGVFLWEISARLRHMKAADYLRSEVPQAHISHWQSLERFQQIPPFADRL